MKEYKVVDFIGIGTPKAATTWLFECLKEHPEICVSRDKEVNFFLDDNFSKGISWYSERFEHCPKDSITGEFSPNYLHNAVAERMYRVAPEAKLIVSLRNPVDRFLSAHRFEYGMGRHNEKDPFKRREWKIRQELKKGLYGSHLRKFLAYFPQEHLLTIFYEDTENGPREVIRNLYTFLDVDSSFTPHALTQKLNVSAADRTRIRALKRGYYAAYRWVTRAAPSTIPLLRYTGVKWLVQKILELNSRQGSRPIPQDISPERREELIEYYREDIALLEGITGRDLQVWLK